MIYAIHLCGIWPKVYLICDEAWVINHGVLFTKSAIIIAIINYRCVILWPSKTSEIQTKMFGLSSNQRQNGVNWKINFTFHVTRWGSQYEKHRWWDIFLSWYLGKRKQTLQTETESIYIIYSIQTQTNMKIYIADNEVHRSFWMNLKHIGSINYSSVFCVIKILYDVVWIWQDDETNMKLSIQVLD